jgi:nucleoside 2-deoxyribosyltransferase
MVEERGCVFVGGPIQYAIRPNESFHRETRSIVELTVAALHDSGHRVLSAHIFENFGKMDVSGKFQEICSRDYQWMQQCDVFVAILPLDADGNVIFSSGTAVELGWASAMDKPIILVCDPAPKYSHLSMGLDAIARVTKVDINRADLAQFLRGEINRVIKYNDVDGTAFANA